jgi:hypothetical protein
VLTPADDYLIHQTPYTMDTVGTTDRNFYDRYFFNGYRRDGEVYFAVAMGQYPNMGVFDCAFATVLNGKERFVRASRALGTDRMDASAGPIRVEIVEPLKKLRITVAKNEWGIEAELMFEARSLPSEEPHFYRRTGGIGVMDYTRMTQHGRWTGTLSIDGQAFNLDDDTWWGSRDHSWGIRGIGGRDPRGAPPTAAPQFFWNWAPVNFDDLCTLYTVSEHADGTPWHESGVILRPYPDAKETDAKVAHELSFTKGTRHISKAKVTLTPPTGDPLVLEFEPQYHFLMQGIGYGEPKWGHGMWVGPNEVTGGEYDLATANALEHLHVQTVCQVTAGQRQGIGIFEHIVLGPYPRYGFMEMMDVAK